MGYLWKTFGNSVFFPKKIGKAIFSPKNF